MFLPTIISNYFQGAPPDTWYYKAARGSEATSLRHGQLPMRSRTTALLRFTFPSRTSTRRSIRVTEVADNLTITRASSPGIRPGVDRGYWRRDEPGHVRRRVLPGFITVILPIATAKTRHSAQQSYLGGTAIRSWWVWRWTP